METQVLTTLLSNFAKRRGEIERELLKREKGVFYMEIDNATQREKMVTQARIE